MMFRQKHAHFQELGFKKQARVPVPILCPPPPVCQDIFWVSFTSARRGMLLVYTITMAFVVFGTTRNLGQLSFEGPVFRPGSTSVFTLVPQHDTDMEDNMDWKAKWNELANNRVVGSTPVYFLS